MCGIFGCVFDDENVSKKSLTKVITGLYRLSETRGKEASGLAIKVHDKIHVHKEAKPASHLIKTARYQDLINEMFDYNSGNNRYASVFIGHARLTTHGLQGINTNNQPVVRKGIVGVHNGIIVNVNEIWEKLDPLNRKFDVDTEILVYLLRHYLDKNKSILRAIRKTYEEIHGTASAAFLFEDLNYLLLTTNTGSLFDYYNEERSIYLFASEKYILQKVIKNNPDLNSRNKYSIEQIKSGQGCLIELNNLKIQKFNYEHCAKELIPAKKNPKRSIIIDTINEIAFSRQSLKRCSNCILPETFPFIEFDNDGVCNYCNNYKKIEYKGHEALAEAIAPYKSKNGEADCIIAFSGGRDSSYSLHYVKTVLGLNPIAYTYDWGMVNDLARRNQARLTGKLGVEQILVSADIKRKRKNIGKNVGAWLKRPDLGMIPLFMAGDKQFFYYANQLKKRTGIKLFLWAENQMERTNFKVGFCGISSGNVKQRIYKMSSINKARIGLYYLKNFTINPAYLNTSILDTVFAYISYYFINHDYLWFFDYLPWDENEINRVLIDEYDWETSKETKTTWRIGDGTAAFYNYIYYVVAGFTENDTLRSNQIREGLIDREDALQLVGIENSPRFDSIKEYLQLINLDFDETMTTINSIPKMYGPKPEYDQLLNS